MIEQFFKLKERKTSIRQEVIGGVTTFLTMVYICLKA
jgi:AGZA family xanthine/uracil permease-like MFS transporter